MTKRSRHHHKNSPLRKNLLLLGTLAGLALPGLSHALEFTVSDGGDAPLNHTDPNGPCTTDAGGICTLRAAIQLANMSPGLDTIYLKSNVNLSRSGTFENVGKAGDLDITDDLLIAGDTLRTVTGYKDRVFHIQNSAKVTLRNLKITGGFLNIDSNTTVPKGAIPGGGGILVQGASTLNLESVTLTNNQLAGETSFILTGGGLYVDALASAYIKDSFITSNRGPGGGGITNLGHTEIRNTTLSNNDAQASNGGGVRNMGGYLHIGNTHISSNKANMGGGIASSDLGVNLGNVIISNSLIERNTAKQFGGGIHNEGPVTLSNSTISYNSAIQDGGGIYNSSLGNMDLINSTISTNDGRSGGGIFNSREITLTNVTIYNNISTPCTSCNSDIGNGNYSLNGSVGGNQITIFKSGVGSSAGITVANTIIADGSDSNQITPACSGLSGYTTLIHSGGGNLETKSGSSLLVDGNSCGLVPTRAIAPDKINSTNLQLDPALAVDPNFTDTTPVHALLAGSDAKDKANGSLCPQVDQRFLQRDNKCDIGAYEYGATVSRQSDMVDLKVSISDNVDPVRPNDDLMPLTYKIILTNLYVNASAQGVDLEIKLPVQFRFTQLTTSSTTTEPDCDTAPDAQGYLRCFMTTLTGLGRVEVFVTGYPTTDGVTITTEAGVTSSTQDAFLGNNHASEDTVVDSNASTTLNFGGLGSSASAGGGGGSLHPWWLLALSGLLLTRRQRRY